VKVFEMFVAFATAATGSLLISATLDDRAWIGAAYAGLVALAAYLRVPPRWGKTDPRENG